MNQHEQIDHGRLTECEECKTTAHYDVPPSGFVRLVDSMGTDADIVAAARVSYGDGTRRMSDDRQLIRYLMRHRHSTPFEMCEIKLHVRVPMDVWRQWIRHRTASVNEYSTRYSKAIDAAATTAPDQWRRQSSDNKQGSAGPLPEDALPPGWSYVEYPGSETINPRYRLTPPSGCMTLEGEVPPSVSELLTAQEADLHCFARQVYEDRLSAGVAREQARKDLPLSTYTEAYWKINLHNLLHFLQLRMDSHAQQEIRQFAEIIGYKIVARLFPLTWEAFCDYRLNAVTFSAVDQYMLRLLLRGVDLRAVSIPIDQWPPAWAAAACRERDEFEAKLSRLTTEPEYAPPPRRANTYSLSDLRSRLLDICEALGEAFQPASGEAILPDFAESIGLQIGDDLAACIVPLAKAYRDLCSRVPTAAAEPQETLQITVPAEVQELLLAQALEQGLTVDELARRRLSGEPA